MKPIPLIIALLATGALTIASGVMAGKLTNRWGSPGHLEAAADKLDAFPDRIGNWRLSSDEALNDYVTGQLQCTGYINRTYVNEQTGTQLSVALIVGPYGPNSVHKPDVCYPNMGYASARRPQKWQPSHRPAASDSSSGPSEDEFWVASFEAKEPGMDPLHVYYAWSSGNHWRAPTYPRFALGGSPVLYRLQISSRFEWTSDTETDNPCTDFLTALIPIWHTSVAYNPEA